MTQASDEFEAATDALRVAEAAYAEAGTQLIQAQRRRRDCWHAYCSETFPTAESLQAHFSPHPPHDGQGSADHG